MLCLSNQKTLTGSPPTLSFCFITSTYIYLKSQSRYNQLNSPQFPLTEISQVSCKCNYAITHIWSPCLVLILLFHWTGICHCFSAAFDWDPLLFGPTNHLLRALSHLPVPANPLCLSPWGKKRPTIYLFYFIFLTYSFYYPISIAKPQLFLIILFFFF